MKRKILCLCLTGLLLCGLASPGFAVEDEPLPDIPVTDEEPVEEEPVDGEPIEEEPTVEEPADGEPIDEEPVDSEPVELPREDVVIQVSVPAYGRVMINPYGMNVVLDGQDSTEQVVSSTQYIRNESEVPVWVGASAVGVSDPGSEVVFADVPPTERTEEKAVFLYAEFQELPFLDWTDDFYDLDNQLQITGWGEEKDSVLYLGAAGMPDSEGAFRVFGSAAPSPDKPWTSMDTIRISVVFTFWPADGRIS